MVGKESRISMNINTLIGHNSFSLASVGDATMVTSDCTDEILIVNAFGKSILNYIAQDSAIMIKDIVDEYSEIYNISRIILEKDIVEFLEILIEKGFLFIE